MSTSTTESKETATTGVGILVVAFTTEEGGDQALAALKQGRKDHKVYYEAAAVIRQDAESGVTYHETSDMSTGKGAGIGALVGGIIGILGGPAGIVIGAGAGAIVGGAVAHGDGSFRDASLEQLGVALKPGTSALAAITSSQFLRAVREQTTDAQMREVVGNLSAEISARLEEGKNVALGLILTEEGLAVQKVAADDKATEVVRIVSTEEGVVGAAAVANEEGSAYVVGVATEEGAVYEAGVATEDGTAVEQGVITEDGAVIRGAAETEGEAVAGMTVITPDEEEDTGKSDGA